MADRPQAGGGADGGGRHDPRSAADTTPAHDINVASLPWALEDREAVVLNRPLKVRDDTSGKVHEFAAGTRFDVSEPIVATLPNAFDAEKRGRR